MAENTYEAVATDEYHDSTTIKTQYPKQRFIQTWLYLSIILGLILFMVFQSTTKTCTTKSSAPVWEDCGDTPDEARRRGCRFDILSFAWQVPECYDHENTEAFRTHNTWSYYTNQNANEQRTEEEVLTGEHQILVTAEYHFTHCTYMWRQLHRAYTIFGYVDDHVDNWNHTLHCQKVLLAGPRTRMAEVKTVGLIRYPKCRRIW